LKSLITSLLLGFALFFIGCDDDPDPTPPEGSIAISSVQSSYDGIRGNTVPVTFQVSAEDGIASVVVTIADEISEMVVSGSTSFDGSVDFVIPADAVLNTEYPITIDVTDTDGDQAFEDSRVIASALITTTPSTYEFVRDGQTTVSFSGQNERLQQVEEIKAYLQQGDLGATITAQELLDAYANVDGNGNGFFSFSSTKQLKDKSFQPDVDEQFMETLFAEAEEASLNPADAADGVAGFLLREDAFNTILVNAQGREFTQMIEKGLMGTVMYNQIYNTYFTDGRIGDDVENTTLREGTNYTDMEHHWDEAFGYWNPPLDFTSDWPSERESEDRFWSHYSNIVDPFIGTNDKIMQGFLEGRAAIVNNDLATKTRVRAEVQDQLDIVAAATAIHYINDTLGALNEGKTGEAFHVLTEAWTFTNALRYNPERRLSIDEIEIILETDFGAEGNFWNVTPQGLNKAKASIVAAYPELESSQNEL